jgi:polyisoprenoid-binding protein YceI
MSEVMKPANIWKYTLSCLMLGLSTPASLALAQETPLRFTLDPTHTFPSFEIRHQGISIMRGKFNKTQGKVVLDPQAQKGQIDVTVDANSVDTGLDDLNQKLRSGIFFNARSFPEIRFVSEKVRFVDGKPVAADGILTMLGKSQPVSLEIRDYACTLQFLTRRPMCGADVHTQIRRSDFGMNFGIPLVGDEVKLAIGVEGFKE